MACVHSQLLFPREKYFLCIGASAVQHSCVFCTSGERNCQQSCTYASCAVVGQVPDSLRKELNNVCKACFTGKHTVPDGDKLASFRDQFISSLDPTVIPLPLSSLKLPCTSKHQKRFLV